MGDVRQDAPGHSLDMRQASLARVHGRLYVAERGAPPVVLLSREALADAVNLLLARHPGGIDYPALTAAGVLLFHRSQLTGPPEGVPEFVAAVRLLGPVYARRRKDVPPALRVFFKDRQDPWEGFSVETAFTTDAWVWWELYKPPARRYLDSDDVDDLLTDEGGRARPALKQPEPHVGDRSHRPPYPVPNV